MSVITSFEKVTTGQKFRTTADQGAFVRVYSHGSFSDFDILPVDMLRLAEHGDMDGAVVTVLRDGEQIEGALHLNGGAPVELVLPADTHLRFTEPHPYLASHTHRKADGFTICDDTGSYWA